MLDELIVSNLGIIESAHLEPGPGFVVVTGETGAGKTMLLGALRLLMGTSARRDLVGPAGGESLVDGRFLFNDGDEVTMRRRVNREGRSKAYLDGSMVPAKALQEKTSAHIEVVGQHDHMLLTTPNGARSLVDAAFGAAGRQAAGDYRKAWEELVLVRQKLELLGGGRRELERELEMAQFQSEEIDAAGFARGDDELLQSRVDRLRNAEDLAQGYELVLESLGDEGAQASFLRTANDLARMVRLDSSLADAVERVDSLAAQLGELHLDLASAASALEHEPGELDDLEERIQQMGTLRRKYGESLSEVLSFGERAAERAAELAELLGTADDLADELAGATDAAVAAAEKLSGQRRKAAKRVARDAISHLTDLGMSDPVLRFDFTASELGPAGADRVDLVFASSPGLTPGPAAKVASGGELSRLTLALRLAAGVGDAQLLAFDEVDAGIGGSTALAMGDKLARLAADRQLFCVTHLPQVAAHAKTHYVVERTGAGAEVRRVDGDERLAELSRMLGGLADSERGQLHAAELLAAAQQTDSR